MTTKIGAKELALREARAKPAVRGIFITPLAGAVKPGMVITDKRGKSGTIVSASSLPQPKPENKVFMPKPRKGAKPKRRGKK